MTMNDDTLIRRKQAQSHINALRLESPVHARLASLATLNDWMDWAGYKAPHSLADEELEYFAIRSTAALFDISPMTKYRIAGPGAQGFLDRLTIRNVAKLGLKRVHYTAWCNDEGHVLDDGTLFHLAPDDYRLCCQERHLPWLLDSAIGYDVSIREETDDIAGFALQGPASFAVLSAAGFGAASALKPFQLEHFSFGNNQIVISRTGFTGDLGYELFVDRQDALSLWDHLMAKGEASRIRAIGYGALNRARIEAGFIVANADFITAETALRPDRLRMPDEIGLDWLVDPAKANFNGRRPIMAARADNSLKYRLVGLEIEGNTPGELALIYHNKKTEAGIITASIWSPILKKTIAIASLKRPYGFTTNENLWTEIYALYELDYRKLMKRVKIVERPFLKLDRRSATPPGQY